MTTDPVPAFEDRLLHALVNEHAVLTGPEFAVPGDASSPAPAPASPRSRRGRSLRPAPALAGLGVAALAVAAVIVAGVHPGRSGDVQSPGGRVQHPATVQVPAHDNVDYVVHRMLSASAINRAVVVDTVHAPDSQTGAPMIDEIWSQHGNDSSYDITLDSAGRPVTGTLLTLRRARTIATNVDYRARTYSTTTYSPNPPGGPAPAPMTLTGSAAQLRASVAGGQATLAGQALVDGRQTLEIVAHADGGTIQLYVDPATYLPIREVDIPAGGTVDGASTITDDSRYLPDTAANRAKLTPAGVIPAGFRKVG